MIDLDDIDSLLKYCKELEEAGGLANRITPSVVIELIAHLRQAEKDAARYRCIKSVARVIECEEFEMDVLDGQDLDAMVDECIDAIQCK